MAEAESDVFLSLRQVLKVSHDLPQDDELGSSWGEDCIYWLPDSIGFNISIVVRIVSLGCKTTIFQYFNCSENCIYRLLDSTDIFQLWWWSYLLVARLQYSMLHEICSMINLCVNLCQASADFLILPINESDWTSDTESTFLPASHHMQERLTRCMLQPQTRQLSLDIQAQ